MRLLKYLLLFAGLAGALVALVNGLRDYGAPRSLPSPASHSTINVIATALPVTVPPVAPSRGVTAPPAPAVDVAPAPVRDVGFRGLFQGMSGLSYEFEQTGPRVDLYVLNPDGRRRYVGTAYDEGDVLRFESFYSPTYQKWGNFPSMRRRGDALVALGAGGVETVYFRRTS